MRFAERPDAAATQSEGRSEASVGCDGNDSDWLMTDYAGRMFAKRRTNGACPWARVRRGDLWPNRTMAWPAFAFSGKRTSHEPELTATYDSELFLPWPSAETFETGRGLVKF